MAADYWQKLKDPRWQRRRLEIMQRADFKCENCDSEDTTLNVHHKLYRKGADPWDYQNHELECLCEPCHEQRHKLNDRLKASLARLYSGEIEIVLGYAVARAIYGDPDAEMQVPSAEIAIGVADVFRVTEQQVIEVQQKHGKVTHDLLWAINHPEVYV